MSLKIEVATELTTCSQCGGTIQKGDRFWLNHGLSEHTNCEMPKPITRGNQEYASEYKSITGLSVRMSDST